MSKPDGDLNYGNAIQIGLIGGAALGAFVVVDVGLYLALGREEWPLALHAGIFVVMAAVITGLLLGVGHGAISQRLKKYWSECHDL